MAETIAADRKNIPRPPHEVVRIFSISGFGFIFLLDKEIALMDNLTTYMPRNVFTKKDYVTIIRQVCTVANVNYHRR